jgi:hypothetical protein
MNACDGIDRIDGIDGDSRFQHPLIPFNPINHRFYSFAPFTVLETSRFGSSVETMVPSSVPFATTSQTEALEGVGIMDADLGGTEFESPLK